MSIYRSANYRKGFTLVELLIVIIIIGVLAGMMMLSSGAATDKAERTAAEVAVRTVRSAINLGMVGANIKADSPIIYNLPNTPGDSSNVILNTILGYLEGTSLKKIGIYIAIDDKNQLNYSINYYPHGDPNERPQYSYDSTDPEKGVVKIYD